MAISLDCSGELKGVTLGVLYTDEGDEMPREERGDMRGDDCKPRKLFDALSDGIIFIEPGP